MDTVVVSPVAGSPTLGDDAPWADIGGLQRGRHPELDRGSLAGQALDPASSPRHLSALAHAAEPDVPILRPDHPAGIESHAVVDHPDQEDLSCCSSVMSIDAALACLRMFANASCAIRYNKSVAPRAALRRTRRGSSPTAPGSSRSRTRRSPRPALLVQDGRPELEHQIAQLGHRRADPLAKFGDVLHLGRVAQLTPEDIQAHRDGDEQLERIVVDVPAIRRRSSSCALNR